ncbi:MAG: hypothetical protein M3220_03125 [Chloroflexota bacterium]|nr:hypothetical protein [Chloroflexota bacterium]
MFSIDVAHAIQQERAADLRQQAAHRQLVKAVQAERQGQDSALRLLARCLSNVIVKRGRRARQPKVSPSQS